MKKILLILLIIIILIFPMSVMAEYFTGKNLFDAEKITLNTYIQLSDGQLLSSSNWHISDYIVVKPNTTYTISGKGGSSTSAGTAFYDKDKNFIAGVNYMGNIETVTTPHNAYYVRFAIRVTVDINACQMEEGTTATPYEPFIPNFPLYILGVTFNETFVHIKNIALAISKTVAEFFYDGEAFTPRAYLFFAYVAVVFIISLFAVLFKRR